MMLSKNVYDKMILKVNMIDTKIPSTSGLINKTQKQSKQTRS